MYTTARILASFLLLLALVHALPSKTLRWIPEAERESLDFSAPLTTPAGVETSLEEIQSKVVFLNFWATWCGPCRKEMPEIVELQEELKSEEFVVVAVSDDRPRDVLEFLDKNSYPFRFLIDPSGALAADVGVPMLPTTLILDSKRRVALAHVGAFDWSLPEVVDKVRSLTKD